MYRCHASLDDSVNGCKTRNAPVSLPGLCRASCLVTALVLLIGTGTKPLVAAGDTDTATFPMNLRVEIVDALVSIRAQSVSVDDIVEEIARQGNVRVISQRTIDAPVTLDLDRVSIPAALGRVLKGHDFLLRIAEERRGAEFSATLWIFSGNPIAQGLSLDVMPTEDQHRTNVERSFRERKSAIQRYATLQGPAGIDYLNEALTDADPRIRREAVALLADLDSADASSLLFASLWDADSQVREEAIHALGQFDATATTQSLHQALADPDDRVRDAAVRALIELDNAESARLLGIALSDGNPSLRADVVYAIGETGEDSSIGFMEAAVKDHDTGVRIAVMESVFRLTPENAIRLLRSGLSDNQSVVREAAIFALDYIDGEEALQLAGKALADPDPMVREAAREVLAAKSGPPNLN